MSSARIILTDSRTWIVGRYHMSQCPWRFRVSMICVTHRKCLWMSFSTKFCASPQMPLTIGSVSIQRKMVFWLTKECSWYTSWYRKYLVERVKEYARTNPNSLCEIELDDHPSDSLYVQVRQIKSDVSHQFFSSSLMSSFSYRHQW